VYCLVLGCRHCSLAWHVDPHGCLLCCNASVQVPPSQRHTLPLAPLGPSSSLGPGLPSSVQVPAAKLVAALQDLLTQARSTASGSVAAGGDDVPRLVWLNEVPEVQGLSAQQQEVMQWLEADAPVGPKCFTPRQ
jgi:hypothetical protein